MENNGETIRQYAFRICVQEDRVMIRQQREYRDPLAGSDTSANGSGHGASTRKLLGTGHLRAAAAGRIRRIAHSAAKHISRCAGRHCRTLMLFFQPCNKSYGADSTSSHTAVCISTSFSQRFHTLQPRQPSVAVIDVTQDLHVTICRHPIRLHHVRMSCCANLRPIANTRRICSVV